MSYFKFGYNVQRYYENGDYPSTSVTHAPHSDDPLKTRCGVKHKAWRPDDPNWSYTVWGVTCARCQRSLAKDDN